MLKRLTMFVIESNRLRPLAARKWYDILARNAKRADWGFMNYGYLPPGGSHVKLEPRDEPDRLTIELYRRAVDGVDLSGAAVIEVGSGRGGGASFLARYCGPAHVTGADFSPPAVELCRRQHAGVPNLSFEVGNAERLPFATASCDALVNVESSHCYGSMAAFVDEAVRVLRPGGHFLFTDFRVKQDVDALDAVLESRKGWQRVMREDITAGVVAALEASDAAKRQWIKEGVGPRFQKAAGEFAGLVGGEMHRRFSDRELFYLRYVYRRV